MLIDQAHLTGRHQRVLSDEQAIVFDDHPSLGRDHDDVFADEFSGH